MKIFDKENRGYLLIAVFIIQAIFFSIRNGKLKEEIELKDFKISELRDSIMRMEVQLSFKELEEHSEIK